MFAGIHAATTTPMKSDGSLDEAQARSQIEFLRDQGTVIGYLVNGHAGENPYLSLEEQIANVRLTRELHPGAVITGGVCAEDPGLSVRTIAALAKAGANAALIFPPWSLVGKGSRASLKHYYASVCAASELPIVLYKPAVFSVQAISVEDMIELSALPKVVAIKEGSWEVIEYEHMREAIQKAAPQISVLGSSDEHFFYNYLSGNVGCQASLVTVLPDPISKMVELIKRGAIGEAHELHSRLAPIARYIYRTGSASDMVARLKLGLVIRGVIDTPHFRAPREPIRPEEENEMRSMISNILR